jgi:hypothetical protein
VSSSGKATAAAGQYAPLWVPNGLRITSAAAATYAFIPSTTQSLVTAGVTNGDGRIPIYLDPLVLPAGTRKYRLLVDLVTNNTAPAITFTVGLYPLTTPAGAANNGVNFTLGTVVSGSSLTFTTPAANSIISADTSDFDAPAAGLYALGIVSSGSQAGTSAVLLIPQILGRTV